MLSATQIDASIKYFLKKLLTNSSSSVPINPAVRSRECNIYRIDIANSNVSLAIKHYHTSANPAAPQLQFDALTRYQQTMTQRESTFRVPVVYMFDNSNRVLVMEWFSGLSLHSHLWKCCYSQPKRNLVIQRTGQWLRAFHEASSIFSAPFHPTKYLEILEERIALYHQTSYGFPHLDPLFTQALITLKKQISARASSNCLYAAAHGDFTPANILLDENTIFGLDIWATERKPIFVDLSRMAVYLTIAYPSLTDFFNHKHTGCVHPNVFALLKGYNLNLSRNDITHFHLSMLSEYMRRWLVIDNRPLTLNRVFNKPFLISRIKHHIRCLISRLG